VNPQTGTQEFESDSVRAGEIRIGTGSWIVLPVYHETPTSAR
jgi:hypothetical protein